MKIDYLDKETQNSIKNRLKNQSLSITFTKTNGEERKMRCSLSPSVIPNQEKKTTRIKMENPDVLSVVDLEKNAWRSFRWDSVTTVEEG